MGKKQDLAVQKQLIYLIQEVGRSEDESEETISKNSLSYFMDFDDKIQIESFKKVFDLLGESKLFKELVAEYADLTYGNITEAVEAIFNSAR